MENFNIKNEKLNESIKIVKSKINQLYSKKETVDIEQIHEIKNELEKIPNLVINFDETMTASDTIRKILNYLADELPEKSEELKAKGDNFRKLATEYRQAKKEGKQYPINLVRYFYTDVINGVNIEKLDKVYDRIIEETEINPNIEKVFEYLKKDQGIKKIPLFVLSLNTNEIIQKFYNKNIDFFKKHNVEIVGIVGNQINTDENNNIIDIYEHVTDENKKNYIPPQSIMLADDRETKSLVEKGINVINVQGEKYKEGLLKLSHDQRELTAIFNEYKDEPKFEKIEAIVLHVVKLINEAKISWETQNDVNILEDMIIAINNVYFDFYNQYGIFKMEL
ncbi:MAG: hypothetical protein US50_C0002G0006 [Candidatus Nomurabacteria bacterium GW2011_GWB1_37_5]|uniref:Uncharacterized protein n=1 Tax=Candidatus Nomurabacteria bacterium GW2011_GWB1_37_5 TaxID=1618742 RepID=A0A0G0K5L7_9BACT|nr:MAG: hypothetical protein US50_C0002G0006 [Candidatus Nomurabacteria bacterium GW2011_GWB1_37_5]